MPGFPSRPRVLMTASGLAAVLGVLLLTSSARIQGADVNDLPRAAPEEVGMSSERLQRVTALMQGHIDEERLAGTVTLIARHGKVVHLEAQGWRDKDAQAPMTEDAIFTIMSMTKPIVSVALMMLYEEGRFLLDDPISKWLPAYAGKQVVVNEAPRPRRERAVRPVTVRHVLTHTSGLSLRPRAGGRAQNQPRPPTLAEAIDRAANIPLNFHPGDQWQYGTSTDFVAILVEKISGESLDDFLRERLFEPLGMDDTYYNIPESKVSRVAAVYAPRGPGNGIELSRAPQYREPRRYFGGQAGLNSTAADYFKFHQMMLNGGELDGMRILSPRTINLMISNHAGDRLVYVKGPGYGFGLGYAVLLDPGQANEHLSPGSFGWLGAWGTVAWVDPVEDMLGIFMTQITSSRNASLHRSFPTVASQAIIKTNRHNPPKVLGYEVLD